MAGDGVLQRRIAVGKVLFERLYGQDEARMRSRGRKDLSLRRVAALLRDVEHCSVSGLRRAIEAHLVVRNLTSVPTLAHLTASHVDAVSGVPPERRQALLAAAIDGRWTAQQLRRETAAPAALTSPCDESILRIVERLRTLLMDGALDAIGEGWEPDEGTANYLSGAMLVAWHRCREIDRQARKHRPQRGSRDAARLAARIRAMRSGRRAGPPRRPSRSGPGGGPRNGRT